jgi:hypothetical protein
MRMAMEGGDGVLTPGMLRAEEALRGGQYAVASTELDSLRPRLIEARPLLRARFERVAALLSVRTGGQWPSQRAETQNVGATRTRVLEAAVNKLRQRVADLPADPTRLTDLAEALAALPKHHQEAKLILERLAARDLVTSAHGYAALSRLRRQLNQENGANQALAACRKLDPKGVACPSVAPPEA